MFRNLNSESEESNDNEQRILSFRFSCDFPAFLMTEWSLVLIWKLSDVRASGAGDWVRGRHDGGIEAGGTYGASSHSAAPDLLPRGVLGNLCCHS